MTSEKGSAPLHRLWPSLMQAGVHALLGMGIIVLLVVVVPVFTNTLLEFDIPLPAASVLTINASLFFTSQSILATAAVLLLLALDLGVLLGLRQIPNVGNTLATVWFVLILLAIACTFCFLTWGFAMSLNALSRILHS